MTHCHLYVPDDSEANLVERRWFAAHAAAKAMHAECAVLLQAKEQADAAWRRARSKLAELEDLRDALGEELALFDGQREPVIPEPVISSMMSAA